MVQPAVAPQALPFPVGHSSQCDSAAACNREATTMPNKKGPPRSTALFWRRQQCWRFYPAARSCAWRIGRLGAEHLRQRDPRRGASTIWADPATALLRGASHAHQMLRSTRSSGVCNDTPGPCV